MADEDVIVDELESEDIVTNNPIEDLLDAIEAENFSKAENHFNDLVNTRVADAVDQTKAAVAKDIYNEIPDVDEDES